MKEVDDIKDLWGGISSSESNLTEPIIKFISAQAEMLSKKTNGNVVAFFKELEKTNHMKLARQLHAITTSVAMATGFGKNLDETDAEEKPKGIDEFYEEKNYEFYIIDKDKTYKYRLFFLECNPVLPIKITLDSDLAKECKIGKELQINNMAECERFLSKILTSFKTQYIITKLMSLK